MAEMQMFPPAPIIVTPTRDTYINSKVLFPPLLQTQYGTCNLWKDQ